ncbi:MAG: hypothetical protein WC687_04860 [Patescibacteria group bacterium]|jgi:hypothetical protein
MQLNNLKGKQAFQYIIFALATFFPGLGFLYITDKTLFFDTDIIKLIFISLLYGLPLMMTWLVTENEEKDKDFIFFKISFYTLMSFYLFILSYQLSYAFRESVSPMIFLYAPTIIIAVITNLDNSKKKKRK